MNFTEPEDASPDGDPLEQALRAALRPVAARQPFGTTLQRRLTRLPRRRRLHSLFLALAASTVAVLAIGAQLEELRGERAQNQLLLALEITSERLGLAQQRIEQFQTQERNP